MKNYGLVTVIIPSYNREKTILRSINSVLNQTYKNIELIVVDDCSTDNTKDVVGGIEDDRLKYIKLDTNSGACTARNHGIKMARGQYIAFQDSDDEWLPEKLEKQLLSLELQSADVCFCRMERHMDESTIRISPVFDGNRIIDRHNLVTHMYVSTQTILAKAIVFEKYLFDPIVKRTQDYDWTIRASKDFIFFFDETILVRQYLQDDSITYSGHMKSIEARRYFLEKYKDEFSDDPEFELFQLRVIARNRAMLGEKPVEEFRRIKSIRPSLFYNVCFVLSKIGLIKYVYYAKGYHKFDN